MPISAPQKPTCTLCLIAKNEGPYLLEWLAYHRLLGFDRTVVYDNESSDGSTDLLEHLARHGVLSHRPWPRVGNESPQTLAYTDAVAQAETDWILFIDADEFLVLRQHRSVAEFLAPHHANPEISAVGVNWRLFGDSGLTHWDPRPVTERFTQAAGPQSATQRHLKTFARVKDILPPARIHLCRTRGRVVHPSGQPMTLANPAGLSQVVEHTVAQVNHYYGKTWEEFQIKVGRGPAVPLDRMYAYGEERFRAHNQNVVPDLAIQPHLGALREEMARLIALAGLQDHPLVTHPLSQAVMART